MRNIVVEELKAVPVMEHRVEVVERKGIGHPDYICDSMMNQISIELCKEYLNKVGVILHHNIDKSLLVAGEAEQKFGGGFLKKPMLMVIGDRATFEVQDQVINVKEIAVKTCKEWIKNNLRFVDPEKDMKYQVELKRGSVALTDLFKRGSKILGANDTSAAVGYAPMTLTERTVLETEKYLNSKEFKKNFPETGEDIKVMGLRQNKELHLTIAMPLIDRFVSDENDYFRKKEILIEEIKELVSQIDLKTLVYLNTLDEKGRGIAGTYLTVTGTSAEDADCGEVGRGNRVN
ncbi:MAG: methionine adenosyltransferase, partial [Methanosarcinales archaeon]